MSLRLQEHWHEKLLIRKLKDTPQASFVVIDDRSTLNHLVSDDGAQ
jgi:hypothetical protein